MTSRDNQASYYDLELPDGTRTEVWAVLRAVLTPEEALGYIKGCILTRIMRDARKPGVYRLREAEKVGVEAGMLREAMEAYMAVPDPYVAAMDAVDSHDPRECEAREEDDAARIADLEREREWIRDHTRKHLADETMRQGAPVVWRDENGRPCAGYYYNKPEGVEFWLAPWDWQAFPPPFNNEPDDSLDAVANRECERFIAELERERDDYRRLYDALSETHTRATADYIAATNEADAALAAEREAHEATRRELDHERERTTALRAEVTSLGETYDAEMDFRVEMRRELGADDSEGFDQFLRRVHRELATLRDRYRPRRQSEEPAPEDEVVLHWEPGRDVWVAGLGMYLTPFQDHESPKPVWWTHQPPAPSEEDVA